MSQFGVWRGLASPIAAISVFGISIGYVLPLLSLMAEARGDSSIQIGLSVACQFFGLMIAAPFTPALCRRFGMPRTMVASLLVSAMSFLAMGVWDSIPGWMILRFIFGASEAVLFIAAETWINESVEDRIRGRVIGVYTTVLAGGIALGPLMIMATGTHGQTPFIAGAAIMFSALIPMAFLRGAIPRLTGRATESFRVLTRRLPIVAAGATAFGFLDAGAFGLLPIYGLAIGLDEAASARLITTLAVGGLVFQVPVGWMADHLPRHALLGWLSLTGALVLGFIPFVQDNIGLVHGLLFLAGGVVGGLWTMSMVILGGFYKGADLAAMNVVTTLLYSIGAVTGPTIMGFGFSVWQPHGVIAIMAAALVTVGVYGLATRPTHSRN